MSRRFVLSRRAVLRGATGAGVACVGLPLLEAMLNSNGDALAGGGALPKQLLVYFIGNGFRLDRFEPAQTGADFTLSEELAPLAPVESHLKVVTGLQNWCAYQFTHHEGMTAFNGYTCAEAVPNALYSKAGGPTLDQVVADHIAATEATPPIIKSIQAGISPKVSIMDSGTTMFALSHRGPNENLDPVFNPQVIWQLLFGEFVDKPDDSELRLAVIDSVRQDANKLRGRLGTVDQQRIDAHLQGLSELEMKINAMPPSCMAPSQPSETNPEGPSNGALTNVNNIMADLLVKALECDITRVASVMFIGGAAETTYTEISQSTNHHSNTHNSNAQQAVHSGVVYSMERLRDLAVKMRDTLDPTGRSLLDSGLILAGSDCSEGLTHSVARQPYILIGNLGNTLTGKVHHQATPRTGTPNQWAATGNTSDVLYTVLKAFNPAATSVGDLTPQQLQGGWYGTSNPPSQAAAGSSTLIDALTGPEFGA
ncbi:MAG: DUF1552 domain-containing protein [Polyangiaceae bacterium]|jgi:hypothetical protein|nr:DUF1552 domain-containing protein [Polyangiaceae bacterium]